MADPYAELFPPFWFTYRQKPATLIGRVHAWDRLSVDPLAKYERTTLNNQAFARKCGGFSFVGLDANG